MKHMTKSRMLESEIFLSSAWMHSKACVCMCVSAGEI